MHVVMHNVASVDGRIDGFMPDIRLYYGLTETWDIDAHLVGADTLIEGEQGEDIAVEEEGTEGDVAADSDDTDAPLLVVTDSKGRISGWQEIVSQPYWSDTLVLGSATTPDEYVRTLENQHVPYVIAGNDYVDLTAAIDELATRGIEGVLVDSGGTLNGALLRAGLIDEVSVLLHPVAVGGTSPRSFIRGPDPQNSPTQLKLIAVEQPADEVVWLRYEVIE